MGVKVIERDFGWRRIQDEVKKMKNAHVKIGVLSGAGVYEQSKGEEVNLADVATWNEFGTLKIPSRPFMRNAFDQNITSLRTFISKQQDSIYSGKSSTQNSLELMGIWFKDKIQDTIEKGNFAPNSEFTKAQKGSDKPLIDTGRLKNSIQHEVKV